MGGDLRSHHLTPPLPEPAHLKGLIETHALAISRKQVPQPLRPGIPSHAALSAPP
jgi:hypothetical protein